MIIKKTKEIWPSHHDHSRDNNLVRKLKEISNTLSLSLKRKKNKDKKEGNGQIINKKFVFYTIKFSIRQIKNDSYIKKE